MERGSEGGRTQTFHREQEAPGDNLKAAIALKRFVINRIESVHSDR